MATRANQEKEAACKYFLAQAIPSAIFLLALILMPDLPATSAVILVALFIKIGVAPCHQWFPSVINALA
jgi:NADH:ubiquinone oxidoreductase subunit 2 (subunit N)